MFRDPVAKLRRLMAKQLTAGGVDYTARIIRARSELLAAIEEARAALSEAQELLAEVDAMLAKSDKSMIEAYVRSVK
jgi:hypothetical protein